MKRNLTISFLTLSILGVVMVYSSSMVWAEYKNGSQYYFLIRQVIFFLIGLCFFILVSKIDTFYFQKYKNIIILIAILLLMLVLVPCIGVVRCCVRSWIGI